VQQAGQVHRPSCRPCHAVTAPACLTSCSTCSTVSKLGRAAGSCAQQEVIRDRSACGQRRGTSGLKPAATRSA
jgi:hypothetical protein